MSILQLTFSAAMFLLALLACVRSGHADETLNDMTVTHEEEILTGLTGEWSADYRVFANDFVQIKRGAPAARNWYPSAGDSWQAAAGNSAARK